MCILIYFRSHTSHRPHVYWRLLLSETTCFSRQTSRTLQRPKCQWRRVHGGRVRFDRRVSHSLKWASTARWWFTSAHSRNKYACSTPAHSNVQYGRGRSFSLGGGRLAAYQQQRAGPRTYLRHHQRRPLFRRVGLRPQWE